MVLAAVLGGGCSNDRSDPLISVTLVSSWGLDDVVLVDVRTDGRFRVRGEEGQSREPPAILEGRFSDTQIDEIEAAVVAAGLDVQRLDLDDPHRYLGVSDASRTWFVATVDGSVRRHSVYALGDLGERLPASPDLTDGWIPAKRNGRVALLDLIDHVQQMARAAT